MSVAKNIDNSSLWFAIQNVKTTEQWTSIFEKANIIVEKAFRIGHECQESKLDIHRVLYYIYSARINVPWERHWKDFHDFRYDKLVQLIEESWIKSEEKIFKNFFNSSPSTPNDFEIWAEENCKKHPSNSVHPIFNFLKNDATYEQLREFILQETPFDIHFSDILAKMLPGVNGLVKEEFAKNYWDEAGHGTHAMTHKELRMKMTRKLNIEDDIYLANIQCFCLEELELVNMYFSAVFNRKRLPEAIGMMLATEMMVPGRLEEQIKGWRRIGFADENMRYLIDHTIIDIEHAEGWMQKVVKPIIYNEPKIMDDIIIGMARRLYYSEKVCESMLEFLTR